MAGLVLGFPLVGVIVIDPLQTTAGDADAADNAMDERYANAVGVGAAGQYYIFTL